MRQCVNPRSRQFAVPLFRSCAKTRLNENAEANASFISIVSQKGGVSKSTLARLVAREYANAGWSVKIADLDIAQSTSFAWQGRRLQAGIEPIIPVERFGTVGNHEPEAVTPRA